MTLDTAEGSLQSNRRPRSPPQEHFPATKSLAGTYSGITLMVAIPGTLIVSAGDGGASA
jgi:hypothetical protein